MLWIAAAVIAVVVVVGGYVFWQYRTAQPPLLDSIPVYTSAIPSTDIPEPRRTTIEAQLRDLAASAQPGYRVAGERFAATNADFVWDALRNNVRAYLDKSSYKIDDKGWSSNNDATYDLYRHDGSLRRWFNDDLIVIAGLVNHPLPTSTGEPVHLYGYFRLTPQ